MEDVALYLLLPLFVLLVVGVPIAFALGLSCAFFLALINLPGLNLVPRAIPMNVLVSEMYGGEPGLRCSRCRCSCFPAS
jgi:hypothetical protein